MSSIIHVFIFLETLTPLLPKWSLLLCKVYRLKWSPSKPPPPMAGQVVYGWPLKKLCSIDRDFDFDLDMKTFLANWKILLFTPPRDEKYQSTTIFRLQLWLTFWQKAKVFGIYLWLWPAWWIANFHITRWDYFYELFFFVSMYNKQD